MRPALIHPEADYQIPERVWSSWTPERGQRELRRALTGRERDTLQRRSVELAGGLHPFVGMERDIVRSALHAMFGGFRSMRQQDENAESAVEVLLCVLRGFPGWAIEEGCLRISTNQTDLSEKWPPNDAQIHAVVSGIVKSYQDALHKIDAILIAPVEGKEGRFPPRQSKPDHPAGYVENKQSQEFIDSEPG